MLTFFFTANPAHAPKSNPNETHCFTKVYLNETIPLICHWCPNDLNKCFIRCFPSKEAFT